MTEQAPANTPSAPHAYGRDPISIRTMLVEMLLAGGASAVLALAAWFVMGRTNMPAFGHSYVLRALAVAGITLTIVAVAVVCHLWMARDGRAGGAGSDSSGERGRREATTAGKAGKTVRASTVTTALSKAVIHLAPALLVITAIGVPLAATRLYLDGVSVDQTFRTQFLTRMADQPGWEDMAYIDMPSFYPGLWFFTGGIFAKLTGIAGWAAYQPWALITLATTGAMLVPVWQRLTASLVTASAISLVTVAVTLALAPEEPYAAIVGMGMPAGAVLGYRAVRGSWRATLGMMVYLGLSANLYTLFTGVSALTVVALAAVAAVMTRTLAPLARLVAMGLGSIAIALLGWGPYLLALLTRPHGPTGTAQHYLPDIGTQIPAPFFQSVVLALLTAVAVVWLLSRPRWSDATSLTIAILVCYSWVILSMLVTAVGTTLLGFRLGLPIMLLLATSGVLGIAQWYRSRSESLGVTGRGLITVNWAALGGEARGRAVLTRVVVVVLAFSGLYYAAAIPSSNEKHIDLAYSDSDGEAKRGDRLPADSTAYYATIDRVLFERLGTRAGAVLLTDEKNFMAFYPYHGYQALTAHYANPLGEFARRNEVIEGWTEISAPKKLLAAMDTAEAENGWKAPDALVLRGQLDVEPVQDDSGALMPEDGELPKVTGTGDGEFSYMIADDLYPNQPNVRFRTITFPAEAFSTGWDLQQVGPYVVAVRQR